MMSVWQTIDLNIAIFFIPKWSEIVELTQQYSVDFLKLTQQKTTQQQSDSNTKPGATNTNESVCCAVLCMFILIWDVLIHCHVVGSQSKIEYIRNSNLCVAVSMQLSYVFMAPNISKHNLCVPFDYKM